MAEKPEQTCGNVAEDSLMRTGEESPPPTRGTPSLKPNKDHATDNEASEGPVREKLKKTSIASIPRQAGSPVVDEASQPEASPTIAEVLESNKSATTDRLEREAIDRGRPIKKRSFDDLGIDKAIQSDYNDQDVASAFERERKRSKDVHASRAPQSNLQEDFVAPHQLPNQANEAWNLSENDHNSTAEQASKEAGRDLIPPIVDTDLADEDMQQSTFSPRKKRSRDQMDADTHREQKIPATEEAKAYRGSEEHERDEKPVNDADSLTKEQSRKQSGEIANISGTAKSVGEDIHKSGFGNTSTISPFASLASAKPSSQSSSTSGRDFPDIKIQAAANGAASSVFLSHSQSSGSLLKGVGPSPSGEARAFEPGSFSGSQNTHAGSWADKGLAQATTNGFLAGQPPSTAQNASVMAPSPFGGAADISNGTGFGGNGVFGRGFGQSAGLGGPRLTSFADPKGGDLTLGKPSTIKPIGAAKGSDDEGTDSEGEGEGEREEDIQGEETDPRFQYQQMDTGEEGEESKFSSSRAKLYGWEGKAWKERGAGVFKFNVSSFDSSDTANPQRRARFIMRAHQTYRILLNTPVFKQMMIGDPVRKGEEPTAKSLSIAVITDNGKPIPYLIRLSDAGEAKALYWEVRNLQDQL